MGEDDLHTAGTEPDPAQAEPQPSVEELVAENAELRGILAAERTRAARVEALNEATSIAVSSLDPNEAARRALDFVVYRLGISAAAAWQIADDRSMKLVASVNFPHAYVKFTSSLPLDADLDNAKVAVTGAPIVNENVAEQNPEAQRRFGALGVRVGAYAIVPIMSKGTAIGVVGFSWPEPRAISAEDVELYNSLAAQLGLALENARLFAAEKSELARTRLLQDLTLSVATENDLEALAEAALAALNRHLGISFANIMVLDGERSELVLLASCGLSEEVARRMARIRLDDPAVLAPKALRTRSFMTHEDEELTPERTALLEMAGAPRTRYIQLPLLYQDQAVGTLGISFEGRRDFTENETRLYQVVAGIVAQAIENARLFQIEHLRARRMEVLHDVSALVASSLDLRRVIAIGLESVVEHIEVRAASVWIQEVDTGILRLLGARGFPDQFLADFAEGIAPDSQFDVARAVRTKQPVVHAEAPTSDVPALVRNAYRRYGIQLGALIVLPLQVGSEVIGALTLAWEDPRTFNSESLDFDISLANIFSSALMNARLFQEARERGERIREIINSMSDAFVTVDRGWHYTLVNPRGSEMLGRSVDDLIGKRMDEEFPDVAGWPYYRRAMEERVPVVFESYAEMAHAWVEVHAYPTLDGISMYVSDITARKNAEERIRRDTAVLAGVNAILEASLAASEIEELGEACLAIVEEVTGSGIGFIAEMGEDGLLHDIALSNPSWSQCSMRGRSGHGQPLDGFEIQGLYGRVAKDGAGFFTNTPGEQPDSIGTPDGHPVVESFLGAPLVQRGATVGMIALGNRPGGYGPDELAALEVMTPSIVQALERLRASKLLSEARSRADMMAKYVDNASVSFGVRGPSGELVLVNRAFEELTGYTADELMGLNWATDLTPPEYAETEAAALAELSVTGGPVQYEKEYIRKDGTRVPIELLANLAYDEDGSPLYYSFITDTTQRKAAEEDLSRAMRLLDAHISNSPLAVVEFDSAFHITRWSDGADRMFGWRADEVMGKAMTDFKWIYEEDAQLVEDESAGLSAGQTQRSLNVNRNYRKDGSIIWCEWYDSAIHDDDGNLVSIFSQVLDVTSRREAEEAVRAALAEVAEERTRLRQIIDEIPVGVALLGPDGEVIEVNGALNRIWGGANPKAQNAAGFAAYQGYHHGTNERMTAEEWPGPLSIRTRRPESRLIDLAKLDGGAAVVRVAALPIFDEDGTLTRVVVIIEDVTAQIDAQRLVTTLNEISLDVSSTLNESTIIGRLTESGREAFDAESAAAIVWRDGGWVVQAGVGIPQDLIGRGLRTNDSQALESILKAVEPVVATDAQQDPRVMGGKLAELGATSAIVLPLISGGKHTGALLFWHTGRRRDFTDSQLEFASKLMTVATLALDNARLYQREHHIAETLQEAILSPPDPVDGLEIAYLYRPASSAANVGGDFYEVVAVENDRIGVMVGDVSGKGIEAARFTTLMKNGARAFLLEGDDPHCVLERLNSLAWRSTPVERFATAFLGVLDVSAGSLRYAGAGHPSALVLGPGGVQTLPSSAGLLGAWDVLHFESATYRLGHDDVLVMYTDGVTEAHRHGELFGEERLIGALEALSGTSVDELPQALLDAVLEFSEGELRDDVVILCLARKR